MEYMIYYPLVCSIVTVGLGAEMPDGLSTLKKIAYSLKPEYTPMGSWIGQIILSTPLSGLSGLAGYYNATQGGC